MNLHFFRSTWGMDTSSLETSLTKIKQAGFDGVELGVPDDLAACASARQLLDHLGLRVVVQQWTKGKTAADHADSFQQQYQRAITLRPIHVNSHTGRDFFSPDQNLLVFDRAAQLEADHGVPVLHETHRGRALFSATATEAFLTARPNLRITADFSHWCCVHESLLEEQLPAVQRAISRARYIHARVGHSQGPQITDPRDPKWHTEIATHLSWWREILTQLKAQRAGSLAICPEFGPPPYMVTLPNTHKPIADLWDINCYMRDFLKATLAA